jgi:two-component system OmpR family response regulator
MHGTSVELEPKKVLVIDDEDDIRRITQVALSRLGGMEVSVAANADEGLKLAEQVHPDVILLDIMMPGTDGTATLRRLRQNPRTADIPVVFLSARASATNESAEALGAQGLLGKPFDPITLADDLRALLRRGRS